MVSKRNYLTVEKPDCEATVDFLDQRWPVQVRLNLQDGKLDVCIMAGRYPNEIIEDKTYDVPESSEED